MADKGGRQGKKPGAERTPHELEALPIELPAAMFSGPGLLTLADLLPDEAERVEVVANGASAIYGSDAIAGVSRTDAPEHATALVIRLDGFNCFEERIPQSRLTGVIV